MLDLIWKKGRKQGQNFLKATTQTVLSFALLQASCWGESPGQRQALWYSLDPYSIQQSLAFYDLYPKSPEGALAKERAMKLLFPFENQREWLPKSMGSQDLEGLISLLAHGQLGEIPEIPKENLTFIQKAAEKLPNRKLPGYYAKSQEEILALAPEDLDLCRALLLFLEEADPRYEALVDLMALQVLARLGPQASPQEKIEEINRLLFLDMGFRFPPKSRFSQFIDEFTFINEILDSRQGVCLGVSSLYLCLGQRLDLPLEAITPPGHIYVRYHEGDEHINIETTARGIPLPDEVYEDLNIKRFSPRSIKEVVGMAFFNEGSILWRRGDYAAAIEAYKNCLKFSPQDPLALEFLACNQVLHGEKDQAMRTFQKIENADLEDWLSPRSVARDYLKGRVGREGILALLPPEKEDRKSLLSKIQELEASLEKYPEFAQGWLQLAFLQLQVQEIKPAIAAFERAQTLDPQSLPVNFYLAAIYIEQRNFPQAWKAFKKAREIAKRAQYFPRALLELENYLTSSCALRSSERSP